MRLSIWVVVWLPVLTRWVSRGSGCCLLGWIGSQDETVGLSDGHVLRSGRLLGACWVVWILDWDLIDLWSSSHWSVLEEVSLRS